MSEPASLRNHFLIAMPALDDPNFAHTVTYMCEHNEEGSLGIIVNRPLELTLGEVLAHMQIEPSASVDVSAPIYFGGPVQPERGFVLHSPPGEWSSSLSITDGIALTTSRDVITAIAHGEGPKHYLLALGYAGWGGGQLEQEIVDNAWLSGPADPHLVFETPVEERWEAAAALLGIDLHLLSSEAGHA